jgi:hypothetical protein
MGASWVDGNLKRYSRRGERLWGAHTEVDDWTGLRNRLLTFDAVLARALERCERGEAPDAVAASFPDHELLPYLELAQCLGQLEPENGAAAAE